MYWLVLLVLVLMGPTPARAENGLSRRHPLWYAQAAVDGRVAAGSTATLVPFGTMTAIIVWLTGWVGSWFIGHRGIERYPRR